MRYLKLINILPLSLFIFALLALPAMAGTHQMSGKLSDDWDVNLLDAYGGDKTFSDHNQIGVSENWIPKKFPSADYIIENNIDPVRVDKKIEPFTDWTGYAATGTHIIKNGLMDSYQQYDEPTIGPVSGRIYCQPAGGEAYDIEALYFDDDNTYMYLAIVTSVPEVGSDGWKMGDIALDISDKDGKVIDSTSTVPYEYGIKVLEGGKVKEGGIEKTIKPGTILYQPTWTKPASYEFPENYPYTIDSGTPASTKADILYTSTGIPNDNGVSNSIIEVRIPRSAIGSPSKDQLSYIHLTIGCGNDFIELKPVKFKSYIPEFPSIVIPIAAVMGIILIMGRRNKE